jgi:hypothetical protein
MICTMFTRLNPDLFVRAGLILILASILVLPGCQSEQISEPQPIGQVIQSMGFPVVYRNNQQYILAPQSIIYASDIFDTNDSSMVLFSLRNLTKVTLGKKSRLSLRSHIQNGDSFSTILTLAKGTVRIITDEQAEVELRTPLAVAELQGGDMYAKFRSNTLEIMLAEQGYVSIKNDDGNVLIDTPLSGTTVIAGSAPQTPYKLPLPKLERAIKGITIK